MSATIHCIVTCGDQLQSDIKQAQVALDTIANISVACPVAGMYCTSYSNTIGSTSVEIAILKVYKYAQRAQDYLHFVNSIMANPLWFNAFTVCCQLLFLTCSGQLVGR